MPFFYLFGQFDFPVFVNLLSNFQHAQIARGATEMLS